MKHELLRKSFLGFLIALVFYLTASLQNVYAQAGSIDTTFNSATGANSDIYTTTLQTDGKIIIGGAFTSYNGVTRNYIARLNTDGSLDTTFNVGTGVSGFQATIYSSAIQSDNKIIIGGNFTSYNGISCASVARLNSDGTLDTSFNSGTGTNDVQTIALQSDGKIIIGGWFSTYNGTYTGHITRINANGTLDTSFKPGAGVSGYNVVVYSTAIQPDGKIIMGGFFYTYTNTSTYIARLNSDGSLDYDGFYIPDSALLNNPVWSIALQSDGEIIIGGSFYQNYGVSGIARLQPNGFFDYNFDYGGFGTRYINTITLQSDGKIIIGGQFTYYNFQSRNYIARLNSDGSLDASFNAGAGANNAVYTTALQSDGKIIIAGGFTSFNGVARNRIARLKGDATLNLTVFLQGFYLGTKEMVNTLHNLGYSSDSTATDTITVNLWLSAHLNNATPDTSVKVILHNNGSAVATFSSSVIGKSYYIAVKHRNSIETWSADSVTFLAKTSYDFSSGLSQAYNNGNDAPMKNMGSGVYALYSGDVNQDGAFDALDMNKAYNDSRSINNFGYIVSDVNGDGGADLLDMIIIYNNVKMTGFFYARPY